MRPRRQDGKTGPKAGAEHEQQGGPGKSSLAGGFTVGAKRISHQRPLGAAARYPGTLHGYRTGPDSYAIIEQGRIGQVLSSKPSDRRAIIEEAAGITKYKTKKRAGRGQARILESKSFAA